MSLDLPTIRAGYRQRYPAYQRLVEEAKPLLAAALVGRLKDVIVDGRAKEPYKFIQKAIRKHLEKPEEYADPLARITDGAGLRAIVAHLDDAESAEAIIGELFDVLDREDVGERYEPNELGYLGLHLQCRLRSTQVGPSDSHLLDLDFEVQIHTRAQNAWSTVSHPLQYKPPAGMASRDVAAKVYRAVALVSLFDEQVSEARAAMRRDPGYLPAVMLDTLYQQFLDWVDQPPDDALSLRVLEVVQGAWAEIDPDTFATTIDAFVRENRARLTAILDLYRADADEHPLLFQPEVLAIAERLEHAPQALAAAWKSCDLPAALLSDTATALGRPLQE